MNKKAKRIQRNKRQLENPNFTGQHLLHNPNTIKQMLAVAGLKPNDTVLDIGAGKGGLTFPLAAQAGKVIAVEIDATFSQLLRNKALASESSNVSIVQADIRSFRLPTLPFYVVANIPFSITTPILEKLLGAEGKAMQKAVLIVEKGAAKRFTGESPRDTRLLMWKMFFIFKLESVIPRTHFAPPPRVDAALMSITRRQEPLVPAQAAKRFQSFAAYVLSAPRLVVGEALRGLFTAAQLRRVLPEAGLSHEKTVQDITLKQWGTLFHAMLKHVPSHRWPR